MNTLKDILRETAVTLAKMVLFFAGFAGPFILVDLITHIFS